MKDVIFYIYIYIVEVDFLMRTHLPSMTNSLSFHCDKRTIQGVAIYHIHIDPDST